VIDDISTLQRGHFNTESCDDIAVAAAAPQCGQWRLPLNIMPKHEAHEIVASFDSQYWQRGESDEIAAPQFGQLSVCACINYIASRAFSSLTLLPRKQGKFWSPMNEIGNAMNENDAWPGRAKADILATPHRAAFCA
jgi:hypothetical protein